MSYSIHFSKDNTLSFINKEITDNSSIAFKFSNENVFDKACEFLSFSFEKDNYITLPGIKELIENFNFGYIAIDDNKKEGVNKDLLKLIGNFNGTVYYHRNEDEKENIRIFKKNFKDEKTGEYKQEYEFVLNSVKVNQEGISSATDFSIKKNRNDLKKLSEIIGTVANTSNDKNFNEGLSLNRASLTSQLAEDKSKYGFSTLFLKEISPVFQYSGNESAVKTENFNYIFSNMECNIPFKMNFEKDKYIISNDNLVLKKNENFISLYDLNSNSVYENGVIRSEKNGFERKLCSNLKKLEFLNVFEDKKNFEKFIEDLSQKVISPENKRASLTDNDKKLLENFKEGLEKFEFLKEDVNENKLKNDFINLFSEKFSR